MNEFEAEMASIEERHLAIHKDSAKQAAKREALLKIAKENMWWWGGFPQIRPVDGQPQLDHNSQPTPRGTKHIF